MKGILAMIFLVALAEGTFFRRHHHYPLWPWSRPNPDQVAPADFTGNIHHANWVCRNTRTGDTMIIKTTVQEEPRPDDQGSGNWDADGENPITGRPPSTQQQQTGGSHNNGRPVTTGDHGVEDEASKVYGAGKIDVRAHTKK